jgi:hypothetical protein
VNPGWRKSSYSANGGANCVEVGAIPWRKSSYTANGGTTCVEVGAVPWRKATYTANGGTTCVEVGAVPWRKATYTANGGTTCVEAGHVRGAVLIRDTTQHGTGPVLRVTPAGWARLTARIRSAQPVG